MAQTVCVIPAPSTWRTCPPSSPIGGGPSSTSSAPASSCSRPNASPSSTSPSRRRQPAVWRWQQRYAEEGVEGLLRDKTRPPGKPPHSTDTVAEVLARDLLRAAR